jgi:hypothetical protein
MKRGCGKGETAHKGSGEQGVDGLSCWVDAGVKAWKEDERRLPISGSHSCSRYYLITKRYCKIYLPKGKQNTLNVDFFIPRILVFNPMS